MINPANLLLQPVADDTAAPDATGVTAVSPEFARLLHKAGNADPIPTDDSYMEHSHYAGGQTADAVVETLDAKGIAVVTMTRSEQGAAILVANSDHEPKALDWVSTDSAPAIDKAAVESGADELPLPEAKAQASLEPTSNKTLRRGEPLPVGNRLPAGIADTDASAGRMESVPTLPDADTAATNNRLDASQRLAGGQFVTAPAVSVGSEAALTSKTVTAADKGFNPAQQALPSVDPRPAPIPSNHSSVRETAVLPNVPPPAHDEGVSTAELASTAAKTGAPAVASTQHPEHSGQQGARGGDAAQTAAAAITPRTILTGTTANVLASKQSNSSPDGFDYSPKQGLSAEVTASRWRTPSQSALGQAANGISGKPAQRLSTSSPGRPDSGAFEPSTATLEPTAQRSANISQVSASQAVASPLTPVAESLALATGVSGGIATQGAAATEVEAGSVRVVERSTVGSAPVTALQLTLGSAQELGERLGMLLGSGRSLQSINGSQLSIALAPAELGRLEIKLSSGPEQNLQVAITTQHAGTRDLVEAQLHRLRSALDEQGFEKVHIDLRDERGGRSGQQPHHESSQDHLSHRAEQFFYQTTTAEGSKPGGAFVPETVGYALSGGIDAYA